MNDIQVSLVASANRVRFWERFYQSCKGNQINWEIIFVGDTPPQKPMPSNFRWIEATVKPAQCYEIGFRAARGELIHWTADDADYSWNTNNRTLEIAYNCYKEMEAKHNNDRLSVVAMRPIEDGGDVWNFHHFFGGWQHTPVMAPFGLVNREKYHELGGYDRRFISGQSENDVVMKFFEAGGRVEIRMDAYVYVHHSQVHPRGPGANKFRLHYNEDRVFLEECWVPSGYGSYIDGSAGNKDVIISKTRLLPVERFEDTEDICTRTQGPKGIW